MSAAAEIPDGLGIRVKCNIKCAHRMPTKQQLNVREAESRCCVVFITGRLCAERNRNRNRTAFVAKEPALTR
jgi:phosphoribosylcarboxyaminoimidazole (NCAIR) mutase